MFCKDQKQIVNLLQEAVINCECDAGLKHARPAEGVRRPFFLVTVLVDRITFKGSINTNKDIRFSGITHQPRGSHYEEFSCSKMIR
jgi:hypothetical protein